MDILQFGVQLMSEKMGTQIDADTASNALSSLLGDGQGGMELAGIADQMASSSDFSNILGSWLGDGANSPISAESVQALLGSEQLSAFASQIGTDSGSAAAGLAELLPQLVDKSSAGGSFLEAAGGVDGLLGAAKSFLG